MAHEPKPRPLTAEDVELHLMTEERLIDRRTGRVRVRGLSPAVESQDDESLGASQGDWEAAVPHVPLPHDDLFFVAQKQADGMYAVTLTEEGLRTFETALGIARDLGGKRRISTYSTIADIMDRTAVREELSQVLRDERTGLRRSSQILLLKRRLRGSEEPSFQQRMIGHLGKVLVVGAVLLWTLLQFFTAIGDIAAIPGILANIPNDILNLHPTSAISEVGDRISDAGTHAMYGVLGVCLTLIAAKVIHPFLRIYRYDQIIPGERPVLELLSWMMRRTQERSRRRQGPAPHRARGTRGS